MRSPQDETLTQVFLTHLVGVFLKQNYPKCISDVVSKILEEKKNYQMFCLNLWSAWHWVFCSKSWKSLFPIFLIFHRTDFGGFLVCCWIAIQKFNGIEKSSVAISLMLNHNLTGLYLFIMLLLLLAVIYLAWQNNVKIKIMKLLLNRQPKIRTELIVIALRMLNLCTVFKTVGQCVLLLNTLTCNSERNLYG